MTSSVNVKLLSDMLLRVQTDPLYKEKDYDLLVIPPSFDTDEVRSLADCFWLNVLVDKDHPYNKCTLVNERKYLGNSEEAV